MILAHPPFHLFLLVFVALVPLFMAMDGADAKTCRRLGIWFGVPFFAYHMFWLVPFLTKWTGSTGLAVLPWLLTILIQLPYFWLLGWAWHQAHSKGLAWMVPLLWVGIEVLRSYIPFAAFPHGLLASPLWQAPPLIQLAAFGTIFLVSGWVVAINQVVSKAFLGTFSRSDWRLSMVLALAPVVSLAFTGQAPRSRDQNIGVGQLGLDMAFGNRQELPTQVGRKVDDLFVYARLQQADLLVLPEGLCGGGDNLPPSTPFTNPPPLPTVFGGQRGHGPVYQSSYAFDGQSWTFSDKSRLVIFGEFVPFREQLGFLDGFNLPSADLVPGQGLNLVQLKQTKVGPSVCFEGMFPDIAIRHQWMGAQMVAIMSIDDWFIDTPMMDSLLSSSAFRAVETGLPVARSSSLGWTAIFGAQGQLLGRLPLRSSNVLVSRVTVPTGPTLPRYWLALAPLLGLLSLVWVFVHRKPTTDRTKSDS